MLRISPLRPLCSRFNTPRTYAAFPSRHARIQSSTPLDLPFAASQIRLISFTPNARLAAEKSKEGAGVNKPNDQPPTSKTPAQSGLLSKILPPSLQPPADTTSSLKNIIKLAKPERKTLTYAIGLLLVSSSVSMSVPFTIGRLIDYFSSKNPQMFLDLPPSGALAILLGIFTVGALANSGRVLLMRLAGQRIVARLRQRTYASALKQEVEMVEKEPGVGDIMSRLSADTNIVGESITGNLSDGLRAIVTASVGLGLMVYLSPTLTLVMLSVVPPIALGSFVYGRYLKKLSNRTQEALGEMSQVAQESLSALRTVQAFHAEKWEEEKFTKKVSKVLDLGKKEAVASGIFYGSTGWAGNLTILTLLGYGGTLVSRGEISVGDLTSLLLYSAYVGSALSMLTSFFTTLMKAVGASTRVFALLSREPAIPTDTGLPLPPPARSIGGVIRFEDVAFEYPTRKGVKVLKNFNLTIPVGGSTAIVGKSGSGKSSIQGLLLRFYDPTEGRITFNGKDIREYRVHEWRSMMSIVPQDPILFTGTIATNIAYGSPETPREEIERAARQANCDFVWDMSQGFDTPIGRSSLSGGQRQRIAIARALLKRPALLCLDEATSALDAVSELRVNEAIEKIMESRTTTSLIVAHRLSTISRAERIVVLEDGKITEEGSYKNLAINPESRFRALMDAQIEAAAGERNVLQSAESESSESETSEEIKEEHDYVQEKVPQEEEIKSNVIVDDTKAAVNKPPVA